MTPYQSGSSNARTQPGLVRWQHCARQMALPAAVEAAGLARRATRDALASWQVTHLEDTALLIVSELVTNVVLHAQSPAAFMMLRLETARSVLRIEVQDADPCWPEPRTPDSMDESGFGFVLVAALSDDWGIRETPSGKAVWVELDTRLDAGAGADAGS